MLVFGGSARWEAEAARATAYLGDTHRLQLGELLAALDAAAAAAAAATTTAGAAAGGEAAAGDKGAPEGTPEKENEANSKDKPAHPPPEPVTAQPAPKRSRKQSAPVRRVEGPAPDAP